MSRRNTCKTLLRVSTLNPVHTVFLQIKSCWQTNVILFTIIYPSGACINKYLKVKVTQSCSTLCDPMDYTVHGIFQARILEWVVVPFSRGSSQPRDQTQVSHICRWALYQLNPKGSPRILEWVAYPFSSGSSWPRNQTGVSCIAGGFFTNWAIRETLISS